MSYASWPEVLDGAAAWALQWDDALELVTRMPAASVDAIVTDPPYASMSGSSSALVKRKHNAGVIGIADSQFFQVWLDQHVAQWARVLKPSGAIWLTIDWRGALCFETACARAGLKAPTVGVWDRERVGMGHLLRKTYECFAVSTQPDFDRITASETDVWRHAWGPTDRKTGHPAEKPVELMRRAIRLVVPPGALILDPFAGSGSTGVAALLEGCRFIGCERDGDIVHAARERIAGASAPPKQPSLFAAGGTR